MKAMRLWAGALLIALGSVGSGAQDAGVRLAEAREELVQGLESHAEQCREERLFRERQLALERLLVLEPGHVTALRGLGYTKGSAGRWNAPRKARAARNRDEAALEDARARWEALLGAYLACVEALIADGSLTREQVLVLRSEILALDPDNARVRAALGEVRRDGEWVLAETAAAARRRQEIADWTRAELARAPEPRSVALDERETRFELDWTEVLEVDGARVLGTVSGDELRRLARALHVARALFQKVFAHEVRLPFRTTVFLLEGTRARDRFLAAHPDIAEGARAGMAALSGIWIQGSANDIAYWIDGEERRLDGVIHLLFQSFLRQAFELPLDRAWVIEGLGLYLTDCLLGTRLTWCTGAGSGSQSGELAELRERLLGSPDWWSEAERESALPSWPRFVALAAKRPEPFTPLDELACYALAGYLIEGHPEDAPRLLRYMAGGQRLASVAFEEVLGLTTSELDLRLQRWVRERARGSSPRIASTGRD